jgi:hypothetical protein
MASGKSLHRTMRKDGTSVNLVKCYMSKDGSPLRREETKVRMSKKERLKRRRKGEAYERNESNTGT